MIKIRLAFILSLILVSIAAWSRQYRVCDVSSAPASVRMADGRQVLRNSILDEKEILRFDKYSKISLMDTKSKEVFFFTGEGTLSVAQTVSKNKTQLRANLKAHLRDLLQGKSHSKLAGVVYKDLEAPVNYPDGTNLLIADKDGNIVDIKEVDENGIYYFVVSNTYSIPYFVNIIRTDAAGNTSACCLSDDALSQMELLIPAEGSVMLTAFPQLGKDMVAATYKIAASEAPFDVMEFLESNPYIRIISPSDMTTLAHRDITLRFLVEDYSKVESADVTLNGMAIGKGIAVTDGINEYKIRLSDYGENLIGLVVRDTLGNNYTKKVAIQYERVNKPKLHILSAGIGSYRSSNIGRLHYAATDAAMVAEILDTLKRMNLHLYDDGGYKMVLTDKDATRGKILKCLDDIRYEADPEDIVMVYLSGHGKYVEFTSQRYFLPYDAEDDMYMESTAISYADLKNKLKQLEDKECKVIVYMDACYAGEMYYTKGADDFIGDSEPAVIGFYSSTRNQPSLEKVELEHGVFTYALLNGLKGGAVDSNGNVTISSLGEYITEQVRIESQGRQTPKVDNGGEDFILFKASDKNLEVPVHFVQKTGKHSAIALAESYYTGTAVAATAEDEFKAYISAAGMGDANSMYMAGVCYELGKGCRQDYTQAIEWYGKAASEGVPAAQYNLGTMHYNGTGTPKSLEMAEKWFNEAARKGYTKASTALGHLYYHKDEPDYRKAFECFSKAADEGDAMALYFLGECHLYGNGTVGNLEAALDAYKKSAEKGYRAAEEKLMEIDY